ncbi:MAG: hypothetical protein SGARI_007248, partial [Bacillariaceae sp.]
IASNNYTYEAQQEAKMQQGRELKQQPGMTEADLNHKSNSNLNRKLKRPRLLLAVSGSVAAVKGPEIAVRLARELQADVKILLTRGGCNFWEKAEKYNPDMWKKLNEMLMMTSNDTSSEMTNSLQKTFEFRKKKSQEEFHGSEASVEDHAREGDQPKQPVGTICVIQADDEWKKWNEMGDPVLHIDLRNWADLLLVAPLSAHSLAKFANGLCDDTLSCVVRAWDFGHSSRQGKPLLLAPAMNTAMWDHPLTQLQLATIEGFWNKNRPLS